MVSSTSLLRPGVKGDFLADLRHKLMYKLQEAQFDLLGLALKEALNLKGKVSKNDLIRLLKVFKWAAKTKHHKEQLQQAIDIWQSDHPSLQLTMKLFNDVHPNYREKFIVNLAINATWRGELKRREFKRTEGMRPPYLAVISPTNRCNLKCTGCYSGLFPRNIPDPMTFEAWDRVIQDCKDMGIHFFTISGGEPFVRRDLLDMFEKHNDCIFQVYTNSTKITDKHIERFTQLGNVAPAISVEGFEEQTDARRGKGVWAKIMDTMDRLKSAGCVFGFSATATRLNGDILASWEFVDLFVEKGCLFGWLFLMTPTGKDDDPKFMPTPRQRDKLRGHVMEIRRTRPIFVADFWNDGCLTDGCLAGGNIYFHVNFKGDVEPCVFIHFADNNIFQWHAQGGHLKDIVMHSPFFQAIRERNRRDPNRLRPCPIIDHNEYLEEAVRLSNAYPTHAGAESIITTHKEAVRRWGEEYGRYAEIAWNSGEYDFFKNCSHLWMADEADWNQAALLHQGGCQSFSTVHNTNGGCGSNGNGNGYHTYNDGRSGLTTLLPLTNVLEGEEEHHNGNGCGYSSNGNGNGKGNFIPLETLRL